MVDNLFAIDFIEVDHDIAAEYDMKRALKRIDTVHQIKLSERGLFLVSEE